MNIQSLIRENKGNIIDVRTRQEFSGGHVAGSKNIPLNELPGQLEELKKLEGPLVVCCASGMRSRQAEYFLNQHGIECYDGGSWLQVNFVQSKSA
ncbi:MAG: rhodanese-like domain-containing protein [Salinimicrobium sp.]